MTSSFATCPLLRSSASQLCFAAGRGRCDLSSARGLSSASHLEVDAASSGHLVRQEDEVEHLERIH